MCLQTPQPLWRQQNEPRNQAIWHRIRSVFAKELRDHSRDKRSVFLSMVFPLLAPVMLGLLLANLGKGIEKAPEAGEGGELPPSIAYVQGSEFAPALMAYLKEQNVSIRPAPEGVSAQASAVRRGRIPCSDNFRRRPKENRGFRFRSFWTGTMPAQQSAVGIS